MQTKKTNIQKKILDISREQFLKHGYRKTSMRTIASKANVGLSNIYNYFKNKDEILEIIMQPVFKELNFMFSKHNDSAYISLTWFDTDDISQLEEFQQHLNFITSYKKELNLLLHKCSGSKYENIRCYIIDRYAESSKIYLELMKDKYPQVNKDISMFFIRTLASWWVQIVSEIVSQNLSKDEITKFTIDYMNFGTGGWERLMNI